MTKQSWSVFVACFNEAEAIRHTAEKISRVMQTIASEFEIVIVDDGSTDGSSEKIKEVEKQNKHVTTVFHEKNKGIGAIQKRAYASARFENVIVIGADGQFNPEELLPHGIIEKGTWLSFYRTEFPSYSLFRKLLSEANKLMNHFLFGLKLKDVNWAMAFKTNDLKKLDLRMNSTLLKSEICIKLTMLGARMIEVPSIYYPRKSGKAKGASMKIIRQAARDMLLLFFEVRRFEKNR